MSNIKSSKADCSQCKLLNEKSLILKTNCKNDLTKVEIIFVSANFNKFDFRDDKAFAPSGNVTFMEQFSNYQLEKRKYLFTSAILCQITDNLEEEDYEAIWKDCRKNLFELINICKPKLIVGLGGTVAKVFDLIKSNTGGITNMRGNIYDWGNYKVFMTFDSTFVDENPNYMNIYQKDFSKIRELITGKKSNMKQANTITKAGEGLQYYSIPPQYYTDEYRLVDIQYIFKNSEILYIFRDKDNNKIYHKHDDSYYFYQCKHDAESRLIVDEKDVYAYNVSWKNKKDIDPDNSYEGDIRLPIKHSIDYYAKNKDELLVSEINNWFCDIEIDMEGDKAFPTPDIAKHPINMISVSYHGQMFVYVLDNGKVGKINTDRDDAIIKVYTNEKMMMMEYIKHIKKEDPDTVSGWNFKNFDMEYIYNRLPQLGISQNSYSKFGVFVVDPKYSKVDSPGMMTLCQLELYKLFTFSTKPSYKLDSIAEAEIGIKKVEMPYSIGDMYYKDVNGLIDYSIRDTELLVKLEDKLGHIRLAHELKATCSSTLGGIISTFGQIDPLVVSYMKKNGKVCKNANYHTNKDSLAGAFVKQPVAGIYETITDFDFSSLYPSIVRTYNIGVNTFIMRTVDPKLGYDLINNRESIPESIPMIIDPLYENKEVNFKKEKLFEVLDDEQLICTVNGCFYTNHKNKISELNEIVEYLLTSRKVYKKKMFDAKVEKDSILENLYNTKQLVYKVIANSLYGVLANNVFRFFNISSAGAITGSGQEAIKNSIIFADAKMKSMEHNTDLIEPKMLTKEETYASEMPDRPTLNIITSDTDSIFCCFENFKDHKNIDNVRKWCDEIQNYLNNDILIKMVNRRNVEAEFNQLNLKNEFVCSKGLFLSKKHYALQIIENEGKKVNEAMHRGIETRRADYPAKTKEMLAELLDMILNRPDTKLKDLMEYIDLQSVEFDKLLENADKSISKNVSFAKPLSEYSAKSFPQNITAMLNWNDIMYNSFQHGDRGFLYKIKGIRENNAPDDVVERYYQKFVGKNRKLDVIALPETEDSLPDFFILDIPPMKEFVFENRWKKMLGPLIELDNQSKNGVLTF